MSSTKLSANDAARNLMSQRLEALEERIAAACREAGRKRADITLLAVGKTQPVEVLQYAHDLGLRRFGENYVQEALDKIAAMPEDCEWHFIGPLQSNKTRPVAEHFDWVHSVDRAKIARRLSEQRPEARGPLKLCLQVNVSGETSKSGVDPSALPALIEAVAALPRLSLQGLMCIPRATPDVARQRAQFRRLRALRDECLPQAPVLSMGMSGDLAAAIAEGATLLRVGTALFGPRPSPARTDPI